jgi:hypothetical protein
MYLTTTSTARRDRSRPAAPDISRLAPVRAGEIPL